MHLRIGYIRVSTQEQNTVRQEALMDSLGVDEVYIDRTYLQLLPQRGWPLLLGRRPEPR